MTRTLRQVNDELAEKSKRLHEVFEAAGEDMDMSKVTILEGDSQAKVEKIQQMNKELSDLGSERDKLEGLDNARKNADDVYQKLNTQSGPVESEDKGQGKPVRKTMGDLFFESKAAEQKHAPHNVDLDLKTLFETGAGWDPEATRIPRVEFDPQRPIAVVDYIPQMTTGMDTIKYMKETTFTNAADGVAEGGAYGEAALAYTEQSQPVEKIGVWMPVTDEQLEDVQGMVGLLNQRMTYMLRNVLDTTVLAGTGTTPQLEGTLNITNLQTQPLGADARPDAIYKAMTKVRSVGFDEPSLVLMHPNDWQSIRLLTTSDGIYIFGSPSDAGSERIWGKPVLQTTAETEGTAIVGDYRQYSALYMKRGIQFQVTNAHSDYFIKGKQAIRADVRMSMVHFRDTAFCEVTDL